MHVITMRTTKPLLLISHCFGVIEIYESFGLVPAQFTPPHYHFALSSYKLIVSSHDAVVPTRNSLSLIGEDSPTGGSR